MGDPIFLSLFSSPYPRSGCLRTPLPLPESLYERVCGREYAPNFLMGLPKILTRGAQLARLARRSSANIAFYFRRYDKNLYCENLAVLHRTGLNDILCYSLTVLYRPANDPGTQMTPGPQMIPKVDRNDSNNGNDPQIGPQMIPGRETIAFP